MSTRTAGGIRPGARAYYAECRTKSNRVYWITVQKELNGPNDPFRMMGLVNQDDFDYRLMKIQYLKRDEYFRILNILKVKH
jgi:hypothetical protein